MFCVSSNAPQNLPQLETFYWTHQFSSQGLIVFYRAPYLAVDSTIAKTECEAVQSSTEGDAVHDFRILFVLLTQLMATINWVAGYDSDSMRD